MPPLSIQDIMEQTKKRLGREDLTTQLGNTEERQIKVEEDEDSLFMAPGATAARAATEEIQLAVAGAIAATTATEDTQLAVPGLTATTAATPRVNPYARLTNSRPRKRKAKENNGSPQGSDHPHAPAPRKTKAKKASSSGKLVDTRSMQRYTRSDVVDLKYALTLIRNIENALAAGNNVLKLLNKLRERLHLIEFHDNLCFQLIKDSKLLEPHGLSKIFGGTSGTTTVQFPDDLADDSLVLHQRWSKGLFDAHLLHGIELKNRTQLDDTTFRSRNLEKDYAFKVSAHYIGAGDLVNGQWWPLQICLIRDGAHGEIEAGICGEPGKGVFSIVLGSSGYDNVDEGDVIKYCGTSGSNGNETGNTKLMMEALRLRNPVRVIRSGANSKKKTVYQPARGLRYDGLYEVVEDELLHQATAMHRFKLERLSGQHAIRYQGIEARPTPEELGSYESIRESLGLKG